MSIKDSVAALIVLKEASRPPALEAPRSWPLHWKARFFDLPCDVQEFIAAHEQKREKEVRRAHNDCALAKQELAKLRQTDRTTDGKTDAA